MNAAGVELPEGFADRAAAREARRTAGRAQRKEIKSLVEGMKADGATRAEIRQALQDTGYQNPSAPGADNAALGRLRPAAASNCHFSRGLTTVLPLFAIVILCVGSAYA